MIIAAQSTPPGKGGVAIIRVSGEGTLEILKSFFKPVKEPKEYKFNRVYFGHFVGMTKNIIDEITVIFYKKGKSYTGEESSEIICHGSDVIVAKILDELFESGKVRQAEAGEFTRLRFMNGLMDLVQAEAVIDLIHSETENSYRSSKEQLEGKLSNELIDIKNSMINLLSDLELELDFAEEDLDFQPPEEIDQKFSTVISVLAKFINSFSTGRIYREGIRVVLTGKVNAGKSSLMNYLLKSDRAIVTDIPGTTRDVIEESIEVGGYLLRLYDTAGFRDTSDIIESEGIKRTEDLLNKADIILHLIDITDNNPDEVGHVDKVLKVYNKIDKLENYTILSDSVYISCKSGDGIDMLKEKIISNIIDKNISYESSHITNKRHYNLLKDVKLSVERARESLNMGQAPEMIILDLRDALDKLGEITGETTSLDIINNIFKNFCIGK